MATDPGIRSSGLAGDDARRSDRFIYRVVVIALSTVALVGLIGLIILDARDNRVPTDPIVALSSASIGALAGLLAPGPSRRR